MAAYFNSPASRSPAPTNYSNSPSSAPVALTNYFNSPSATPPALANLYLWYDAQDINLLGNVGVANNDPVGTWKNKGSVGSAGDIVQAVGAAKPTFKTIASAGKLNNLSSISFDGGDYITVAAGLTINQPDIFAIVVRTSVTTSSVMIETNNPTNTQQFSINAGPWHMYAGTERDTTIAATTGTYHLIVMSWAAASSTFRADKVQGNPVGSPGTGNGTGFTLGAQAAGATWMTGEIVECLVYTGSLPAISDIESYFDAKYGSSWPQ